MDSLEVMRAIDKLDRIGRQGVKELLTVGRRDGSGAFTKGLGLGDNQAELILMFVCDTKGATNEETLRKYERWFKVMSLTPKQLEIACIALGIEYRRYDSVVE